MLTICIATERSLHTQWQGISQRLRDAAIEKIVDLAEGEKSPDTCQAVVFAGARALEKEVIERVLRAGKHVLLATEPYLSSDELATLSGVAQSRGVQFAMVNPDRYLPSRQLIKQQIGSKLGEVGLVRVHRWEQTASEFQPDRAGLPGPLVRDLELVLWLAGKSPNVVYALEQGATGRDAPTGRTLQIHLGFASGMALIDYDSRLPSGTGYQSLSVIGATGAAYADDHQNMQLLYRGGAPQAVPTGEGTKHLAAMVQDFVDAVAVGSDLSATVTAWRGVLTVVSAVRQSLATHRAIALEGA